MHLQYQDGAVSGAALNAAAPPGMSSPIIPWRVVSQAMNRRRTDQSSDRPMSGQNES